MIPVYYQNKALVFTRRESSVDHCAAPFEVIHPEEVADLTPANLVQKFENYNTVYLVSPNPEGALERFSRDFTIVEAAGGVVENHQGEILMMRRRGWWDLPKGHIEPGETSPEAALREVAEETGLNGVVLGELITSTLHIYDTYGHWEMKRTWWYRMSYPGQESPVPQSEEGITEIRWMKSQPLVQAVAKSYSTIGEVFACYFRQPRE